MKSTVSSIHTSRILVCVESTLRKCPYCHRLLLGFNHSAFTLCTEGALQNSPWFSKHVPRGELIELLSKALLYLEVESHWHDDSMTTNCKNNFSLLERHVCSGDSSSAVPLKPPAVPSATSRFAPSLKAATNTIFPSNRDVSTSRNPQVRQISGEGFYGNAPNTQTNGTLTPNDIKTKRKVSPIQIDGPAEKRARRELDDIEPDTPTQNNVKQANQTIPTQSSYVRMLGPTHNSRPHDGGADALKRPRARISQGPIDDATNPKAIMTLPGHRTEVFVCSFNPTKHAQLATGYAQPPATLIGISASYV